MSYFALASLLVGLASAQSQRADNSPALLDMSVQFSVDVPLDVPGAALEPGTYVLRVRHEPAAAGELAQLQLWDANQTHVLATMSAIQSIRPESPPPTSLMSYYEGPSGRRVLKAWNVLNTRYVERIVYPPAQAAELGKVTSETVLAIPAGGVTPAPIEEPAAPPDTTPSPTALPRVFPKTAGDLPLIIWFGFTALAAFLVFRFYRIDPSVAQNARNNAVARRAAGAAYRTYKTSRHDRPARS